MIKLSRWHYKKWPYAGLGLLLIFSLPILLAGIKPIVLKEIPGYGTEGFIEVALRTSLFAIGCSAVTLILGFFAAFFLKSVDTRTERLLIILALPLLVGDVTAGFVLKLSLAELIIHSTSLLNRSPIESLLFLGAVQIWQMLPLTAYIISRHFRSFSRDYLELAMTARLSMGERIRDIFFPQSRNIIILLSLFCTVFAALEYNKSQLLIKPSRGTSTELVSHFLVRTYDYYSLSNPVEAFDITLAYGAAFVVLIVALVFISVTLNLWLLKGATGLRILGNQLKFFTGPFGSYSTALCLFAIVILPFFILAIKTFGEMSLPTFDFTLNFLESLFVCSLLVLIVVWFAITSRLAWPIYLSRLDERSTKFFVVILSVKFLPPICLAFAGYQWLTWLSLSQSSQIGMVFTWVIAQLILAFPLIAAFTLYTHFSVQNSEIQFQDACRASPIEIGRVSFVSRFKMEYFFIAFMAFSLIWNESTLNTVFGSWTRDIPSLAVELTRRVEGRSGSYAEAASLILTSLTPVIIAMLVWQWIPLSNNTTERVTN